MSCISEALRLSGSPCRGVRARIPPLERESNRRTGFCAICWRWKKSTAPVPGRAELADRCFPWWMQCCLDRKQMASTPEIKPMNLPPIRRDDGALSFLHTMPPGIFCPLFCLVHRDFRVVLLLPLRGPIPARHRVGCGLRTVGVLRHHQVTPRTHAQVGIPDPMMVNRRHHFSSAVNTINPTATAAVVEPQLFHGSSSCAGAGGWVRGAAEEWSS